MSIKSQKLVAATAVGQDILRGRALIYKYVKCGNSGNESEVNRGWQLLNEMVGSYPMLNKGCTAEKGSHIRKCVEIESIGTDALFLSSYESMSVPTLHCPEFRPDSIYIIDHGYTFVLLYSGNGNIAGQSFNCGAGGELLGFCPL
ncbi:unnamed protein product [Prunus armeniaca]|uniref:Uncharacterized protein n=1 Tax=Prunus armeniaca TaxID=36596 RepID=A0A6J5ULH6_PRUAR|nr:unnamed protein product [Prunus armeniaca]